MRNRLQPWSVPEREWPDAQPQRTARFILEDRTRERQVRSILRRLPPLLGEPLVIATARGLRDSHGAVHAGSFLRLRRIAFDCAPSEFPRVFVHELFHFVWMRAANRTRRAFGELLTLELQTGVRGELGWSSEWRKERLRPQDPLARSRRWREYCCESFCDTAAWLYSGIETHDEFTLATRHRQKRRRWFDARIGAGSLSI